VITYNAQQLQNSQIKGFFMFHSKDERSKLTSLPYLVLLIGTVTALLALSGLTKSAMQDLGIINPEIMLILSQAIVILTIVKLAFDAIREKEVERANNAILKAHLLIFPLILGTILANLVMGKALSENGPELYLALMGSCTLLSLHLLGATTKRTPSFFIFLFFSVAPFSTFYALLLTGNDTALAWLFQSDFGGNYFIFTLVIPEFTQAYIAIKKKRPPQP